MNFVLSYKYFPRFSNHLLYKEKLLPPAKEVWGKVICLQACVCPQGGVPDQVYPPGPGTPPGTGYTLLGPGTSPKQTPPWTRSTPLGPGTPPDPGTPPGADTPLAQSMLGDTVNARAVRILLECNLVKNCLATSFSWVG